MEEGTAGSNQSPAQERTALDQSRKTDNETRRHLISGRLVDNIQKGKDRRFDVGKDPWGADSELNMWTPENMQAVIILQTPEKFRDLEALKKCWKRSRVLMGRRTRA